MTIKPDRREHLHSVLDGLEQRLRELVECEPRLRSEFSPVPKVPAIYLLYEDDEPVYVGRTRDLRRRLGDHMRPSNNRYSATFAFRLAKKDAKSSGVSIDRPDAALEADPDFDAIFRAAKKRVASMHVRYLELRDPIEQTLLEVYAAESLATPYNSFETH